MKKVGIIRCQQTEDVCHGSADLAAAAEGTQAFEPFGPCRVIDMVTCGGCPGKWAVVRAKMMADRGAEAIFLASCIKNGFPIGMACPNLKAMISAITNKISPVPLIDWTIEE